MQTLPATTPRRLLLLGGTSDIGRATALAFARKGWAIDLAGRNLPGLKREAADIAARSGAAVTIHGFDVLDTDAFAPFIAALPALPDTVVCVVGVLGDQERAETDLVHAAEVMRANYEGPALILGLLAERFVARGTGTLVGVSSVAGERGRGSNYVYGSAKAGFTAFLSGLRNRLAPRGVHVVTVKPGFVRTKMVAGKPLPGPLTAEPEQVGEAIYRAAERRADVLYVGRRWGLIMAIIRAIPERVFKKLKL